MVEQNDKRPLPPVTAAQRTYLHRLWRASRSGRGKLQPPWGLGVPFRDPDDPQVIAGVVAVHPVFDEPWLVRGLLRTSDAAPALTRVSIEHLTDPGREVTGAVVQRLPLARIRDTARAWLEPQELIADVLAARWPISPEQKRWARRVTAEASKPLRRGRGGYPPEHYMRIAIRAVKLFEDGRRDVLARLSQEENKPYQTVRDWISRARSLGFLEPTKQGRSDFRPGPNLNRKED